jgi:integrin alpha FG-GAP repeat containing protein 1
MSLPYAFTGLGRTNNYIEELSIGVSRNQTDELTFTGIIPNSQLIVYPYDATEWKLELFINPDQYAWNVLKALIISLLVLFLVTGILYWFEKREDEREKIYWI